MYGNYDENISENPFFADFKAEFSNLFQHCISQSWIICVPRISSLMTRVYTVEDFCAHVLVPSDELPESHYSTLTEKQLTVVNKVITFEVNKGLPLQSHILFEETFYTEDSIKYNVWCIETPLEPSAMRGENAVAADYLLSINDCIDLLWTQAAGRQVLDQIEFCVHQFLKINPSLPVAIAPLRELVSELYTQCLQTALQNRRLREKSKSCMQVLDNIKLAVECYMQHLLFNFIFKPICTCCAYEDSHLNKKIRNLSDIQLRDFDIKKELYHAVPRAKQILSKLNSYNTVLEKVLCLKHALNAINKVGDNSILLTADDMLPVFVFLVIKSNLPNWYSQLTYMKEFRFSGTAKGNGDESAFLITTLEAVVQHIQSGALAGPPNPEAYYYESDLTEEKLGTSTQKRENSLTESISTTDTNSGDETLEYIFELIKASYNEQVRAILERNKKHLSGLQNSETKMIRLALNANEFYDDDDESDDDMEPKLCHPLCNCNKCCQKISRNLLKASPTVTSRDSHCLTPLHIASIHGKAAIVETLIELGSDIDASDLNECTPLHYAASRGHQNALLLLMHSGANINKLNIDKNTALHMSVNNGHMNCVKALIYFAEHSRKKLMINCANESGNSPLHLASKWGYEGIARLLIENGAEPSLSNHYGKTAFDYAHNLRILQVLKSCSPNLYEYIHITNSNVTALNCKPDNPVAAKLQAIASKTNDVKSASRAVENLKRIDRILKAISYGDVKLACFYMNINYAALVDESDKTKEACHPLCECQSCKKTIESYTSDFDVNYCDSNGVTALHYASLYGLPELCHILILNKADVNVANKKGQTPLHLAALSNKASVLRILLDNGSHINAIDAAGNTALHDASQMGNIGAVKILIAYGPDTTIRNGSEKSALDIAKDRVYLTIIDLIEKRTHLKIM